MARWYPNPGLPKEFKVQVEAARDAMNADPNHIGKVSNGDIIQQAVKEWLERYNANPAAVKRPKE